MNIFSVGAVAVISVIAYLLIKKQNPEIAVAIPLTATAVIISLSSGGMWQLREFISVADTGDFSEYLSIPLKALGIMILSKIAENVCSDEKAVAYSVSLFTKIYLVTLTLPLIEKLIVLLGDVYKI